MSKAVEEIREKSLSEYLLANGYDLKKSNNKLKMLCPFHDDHNPSMSIDDKTNRFVCWSCGEKGDIFDFVMKINGDDFFHATKALKEFYGIKEHSEMSDDDKSMYWMARIYNDVLNKNPNAKNYLAERLINEEDIERWGIGLSGTGDFLEKRIKHNKAFFESNGYIKQQSNGEGYYDMFQNRVMFPIHSETGVLVGFGGRYLGNCPSDKPKYINSSASDRFDKSNILYGLYQAKKTDYKLLKQSALVVEGYTDVIAMHKMGFTNAVATCGTAFTEEHAKLLLKETNQIVFVFDGDQAGKKALNEALKICLKHASIDKDFAYVLLDEGADPCDYMVKNSAKDLNEKLNHAKGFEDYIEKRLSMIECERPFLTKLKRYKIYQQLLEGAEEKLVAFLAEHLRDQGVF
ncbi:hypothetical protein A3715_13955 [Oleiphilus sp. HI0009]|nr:hypothetical protein A3715_13955 [Oleiphilus sp. HI0009]